MNKESDVFPLVSIITPSYNSMPYIIETIKSVLAQDYPAIEHIVVDGGSTDGTVEVLKQYPHLHWVSEPDRGQSHALNKGFRMASGQIIGWLNSDDVYESNAIPVAVKSLYSAPDIDLVYSDLGILDQTGARVGITKSQPFDLQTLLLENHIKQPTVFMRRKVLDQLGGVDEDLHYVMDRELWLRAGMAGFKMMYLENHIAANFRLIPGTKSHDKVSSFRSEWLSVLKKTFEQPEWKQLSADVKEQILKKVNSKYYWALASSASEEKKIDKFLLNLSKSIFDDPVLLINKGFWYFLAHGVLGFNIDKLRKFKKSDKLSGKSSI